MNDTSENISLDAQFCCRYLLEKGSISLTKHNSTLYYSCLQHKDTISQVFTHLFKRVEFKNDRILVYDELKNQAFTEQEPVAETLMKFSYALGRKRPLNFNDGFVLMCLADLYTHEIWQNGNSRVFVEKRQLQEFFKDFKQIHDDDKKISDTLMRSLNKFLDYQIITPTDVAQRYEINKLIEDVVDEPFFKQIKTSVQLYLNKINE